MLGDPAAATIEGQVAALALMGSTCTIRRVSGVSVDPLTGADTPTYEPVSAQPWPCKVKVATVSVTEPGSLEATRLVTRVELHVPWDASPPVAVGDVAEVLSSRNPRLMGRKFRITGRHDEDYQTAQRLPVEEVS